MDKVIIDKVAKLIALAENNDNEHQAASARAKAAELMRKHGVSPDDLRRDQFCTVEYEWHSSLMFDYDIRLWMAVGAFAGTFVAYSQGYTPGQRAKRRAKVYLAGMKEDIEITRYLFEAIRNQITAQASQYSASVKGKHDYKVGLVKGCIHRMREIIQAAEPYAGDQEYALVLASKQTKIEDWYASQHEIEERDSPPREISREMVDGYRDSEQLHVSPGINGAGHGARTGGAKYVSGDRISFTTPAYGTKTRVTGTVYLVDGAEVVIYVDSKWDRLPAAVRVPIDQVKDYVE